MKVPMHDPETGTIAILTRRAPGAGIPFHEHEAMEQTGIVEGSHKDGEWEVAAGIS